MPAAPSSASWSPVAPTPPERANPPHRPLPGRSPRKGISMAQPSGKKARSVVQLFMVPRRLPSPSQTQSHRGSPRPGPRLWFELPLPREPGRTRTGLSSSSAAPSRRTSAVGPSVAGPTGRARSSTSSTGGVDTQSSWGRWSATCLHRALKVVAFDGLSHGRSDAGVHGSGSSDAVELGRALDAVAAKFGPAVPSWPTPWARSRHSSRCATDGSPPRRLVPHRPGRRSARLPRTVPRSTALRSADGTTSHRAPSSGTGYPVADLDVARLGEQLESRPELLVIHDPRDRETPSSPRPTRGGMAWRRTVLDRRPGARRILADAAVGGTVARFAARLPVEPSLHAACPPLRSSSSGRAAWHEQSGAPRASSAASALLPCGHGLHRCRVTSVGTTASVRCWSARR